MHDATTTLPASPLSRVAARVPVNHGLVISLGTFLLVVAIAESHGAYHPTSWGWCVLVFSWIGGLALVLCANVALEWLELAFLAALAVVVAWMALSIMWSSDVDQSVLEVQRGLVYLVGVLAAVLVIRERSVGHLLGGLLAGAVWISGQALGGRLFPAPAPGNTELDLGRLADPIGYFNALGLFAVMAALLALAIAINGRHHAGRAAAAAAIPLLVTTAYYTYSRGAGLALAAGLAAMVALDPRRLRLLAMGVVVALPAAVAVWLAARAPGLTSITAPRATIAEEGRELAFVLLALTIVSAALARFVASVEPRVRVPETVRRGFGVLLACVAVIFVAAVLVQQGGPGPLVNKTYDRINTEPTTAGTPADLNQRLHSISSTGRIDHWRVTLVEHKEHPWLGSGAGTYEQFWVRDRRLGFQVRDAHSLYLETLGQLGWLGLGLLVVMLALPVVGAVRARRHPLVAGAFGAYVAYLVRTGIDWDWEMPAVTLFALVCGVALFAAADDRVAARHPIPDAWRWAALAATAALTAFSVFGLVGNRALADATRKIDLADFRGGEADARKAVRWAPWSAEALQQRGRAEVGLQRRREGRASLREAASKRPADWQIWYDLGIASTGRERTRALIKAATLNPKEPDIDVLRQRGDIPRSAGIPK